MSEQLLVPAPFYRAFPDREIDPLDALIEVTALWWMAGGMLALAWATWFAKEVRG